MEFPTRVVATQFVLAVPCLVEAERYWCGVLGFAKRESPDGWLFLSLGGHGAMLGECPDAPPPSAIGDHSYFGYFELDDVDAFACSLAERDAMVLSGPADKPWGMREMAVATPAGHRMMFGQRLT